MYLKNSMCRNVLMSLIMCLLGFGVFTVMPATAMAETKFNIRGDIHVSLAWIDGVSLLGDDQYIDRFNPRQRVRIWMFAKTSESVQAVAMFRMATGRWGQSKFADGRDAGYALDADGVNIRTRFLFVNWQEPDSPWSARIGIIPVNVPKTAYFSGVLDSSAGGIEIGHKFNENIHVYATWARPFDAYEVDPANKTGKTKNLDDEMDLFMLRIPLTFKQNNISVTPWVLYGNIGKDSDYWQSAYVFKLNKMTENGKGWWTGVASQFDIMEDMTFSFDFLYGNIKTNHDMNNYNSRGWNMVAALRYKQDWGIPGLFAWYGTGSKASQIERDSQWGVVPAISTFDVGFDVTSFGFGGSHALCMGGVISDQIGGRWGFGGEIRDFVLVDSLSHTARVAYYRGTNDKRIADMDTAHHFKSKIGLSDLVLMTTNDDAAEFNFTTEWKVYDNLSIFNDLGYIRLERGNEWKDLKGGQNLWQFATTFEYRF